MKGLASKETHKLLEDSVEKNLAIVPEKFWCHNPLSRTDYCCFWHFIFFPFKGPERDGIYHPVYEYEKIILDALSDKPEMLEKNKHIAVFKATGLGLTELVLLWILWKSYTDNFFYGKEAMIITGPNVDLAQDLVRRAKKFLFNKSLPYLDKGVYELEVNGSLIKCYPSNNIASARGKPKVSVFFGDESAFFKLKDDTTVRTVGERYIGKSDSYVIWVSTAGEEAGGFFYEIMQELEKETIYQRFHFYVEAGLKKDPITKTSIFSDTQIKNASAARSYAREYLGLWGQNVGDIFSQESLDQISKEEYPINDSDETNNRVMGIDPGFGSSEFGIVVFQKFKNRKCVIFAESYERASYIEMMQKIDDTCKRLKLRKLFIDNSWAEGIRDLRDKYHYDVTGIAFNQYGEKMLGYAADNVSELTVIIHPMFKKLKFQLMTIKYNEKGLPDKTKHNPFDIGDAFLLGLYYYKMGSGIIAGIS